MNDDSEDDKPTSSLDLLFSALGKFARAAEPNRSRPAPRAGTGGSGSIRFGSRPGCCIARRGPASPPKK